MCHEGKEEESKKGLMRAYDKPRCTGEKLFVDFSSAHMVNGGQVNDCGLSYIFLNIHPQISFCRCRLILFQEANC
jgi:hypothetical protein